MSGGDGDDGGRDHPNYRAIEPPRDKDPEEYDYRARRAEILMFIESAGGPTNLTQARLAERFDVHRSVICRDFDRLSDYVSDHIGEQVHLSLHGLHARVISDLLEEEDDWRAKKAAWDVALDYAEWAGVVPGDDDHAGQPGDGTLPAGGGIDVDDDGLVTTELPEQAKENLDALHDEVRRATLPTRIDENGDDLDADDVGLTDD